MRRDAKPPKAKVGAKPTGARKSRKNDGSRVRDLEKRLEEALQREAEAQRREAEALEQQTAAAEILRVISSSPTDVQPVFDSIAKNGTTLCDAAWGAVIRFDGQLLTLMAQHNMTPSELELLSRTYPRTPTRGRATGRAIIDRRTVHVPDIREDPDYLSPFQQALGFRTVLAVPMLRDGEPIGVLALWRREVRPFTDQQIALMETFADQAVIAIENVRLFRELESRNRELSQALDQQTATSEILRIIGSSPTDAQPVFETIARSAVTVCAALGCAVFIVDGDLIRVAATHGVRPERVERFRVEFPQPLTSDYFDGARIIRERSLFHLADIERNPNATAQDVEYARLGGYRTRLMVPMVRGQSSVGLIAVTREAPTAFTDQQVDLLKTFADQAVIAIENVRLFKELQSRNQELTETLARQTATSDVLRAISGAHTDPQPVFDIIAASALQLCGAVFSAMVLYDGEILRLVAIQNAQPKGAEALRNAFPRPLDEGSATSRAIRSRAVVNIPDVFKDPHFAYGSVARAANYRSVLAVPMLRDGEPVGVILATRPEAGSFSGKETELLRTFADQAVIAIENVRLFKELESSNRELRIALDQQTATSEVLKIISRSAFDLEPVLQTLVENAGRLCNADFGIIFRFDGEVFRSAADYGLSAEYRDFVLRNPIRPGRGSITGRAALERRTVHIPDVLADPEYELTERQRVGGYRSNLGVPMFREGVLIGVFALTKYEVEPFTDKQIELVTTFADQAVIAMENARLLGELQSRTVELTRSVEELKALGEVGRAVSSTLDLRTVLDTIVTRAVELSGTGGGFIYEFDDATQEFHLRATHQVEDELAEALRVEPIRLGEGATGRAAATRAPVQITDTLDEREYPFTRIRSILTRLGYRSVLAVPLLLEQRVLGALVVQRRESGTFAPEVVNLLQTFATQSALAIQNARLFLEIEDKSRQLEVASQHKSEFLANMSHELRTPLNAIIGFSEVLTERMFGDLNEKQEEYLTDISSSGTHLLSLINDILDLSKIEAGRMELELTDLHLPTALDNALALVRERAGRRSIALHTSVDKRLGEVRADERKIRQVVLNLLSNAIKFTPEGGRIEVAAVRKDGSVEVSVSDTGVGIAPQDQEAVFEEFRQVGTADKKAEGTGLGLTLCRKFIELHGGRIWVKSQVGEGSTFTFTIPVRFGE